MAKPNCSQNKGILHEFSFLSFEKIKTKEVFFSFCLLYSKTLRCSSGYNSFRRATARYCSSDNVLMVQISCFNNRRRQKNIKKQKNKQKRNIFDILFSIRHGSSTFFQKNTLYNI
jgi:hypothetical protein